MNNLQNRFIEYAELAKIVREEKEQLRKTQDRHKYMMGGCVVKYFPDAYDFSEQEMNRIIACAFSLKDVKNMINTTGLFSNLRARKSMTASICKFAVSQPVWCECRYLGPVIS